MLRFKMFSRLWRNVEFLFLWSGQTISLLGSQLTGLAIPLLASLALDASTFEMGILQAMQFLPFLVFGLFAGVWVDRNRCKPIMIISDLVRSICIALIPFVFWFGQLNMAWLCALGFLTGIGTVFFDVASMSYLPKIVEADHLLEGNSKLEFSNSMASILGQGLGGGLVQLMTAPFALIIDAFSFLISISSLLFIRKQEPRFEYNQNGGRREVWIGILEGLKIVFDNGILRSIALATCTFNFFSTFVTPAYLIYLTRSMHLAPFLIGIIFSMSGVGALIGIFMTPWVERKLGVGNAISFSMLMAGIGASIVLLTVFVPSIISVVLLMLAQLLDAIFLVVNNITQRSLRVSITPKNLHGRMNASIRFAMFGVIPIADVLGGKFGDYYGVIPTLALGTAGVLISSLFYFFSPIQQVKRLPQALSN